MHADARPFDTLRDTDTILLASRTGPRASPG
jgi:hypothetical protein